MMETAYSIVDATAQLQSDSAKKVKIQKSYVSELPARFEESYPANGMQDDGAEASYRDGREHIIGYEEHWEMHLDGVDPETEPVGHMIEDAPAETALLCLFIVAWYWKQ
jgi:hypothetical protein